MSGNLDPRRKTQEEGQRALSNTIIGARVDTFSVEPLSFTPMPNCTYELTFNNEGQLSAHFSRRGQKELVALPSITTTRQGLHDLCRLILDASVHISTQYPELNRHLRTDLKFENIRVGFNQLDKEQIWQKVNSELPAENNEINRRSWPKNYTINNQLTVGEITISDHHGRTATRTSTQKISIGRSSSYRISLDPDTESIPWMTWQVFAAAVLSDPELGLKAIDIKDIITRVRNLPFLPIKNDHLISNELDSTSTQANTMVSNTNVIEVDSGIRNEEVENYLRTFDSPPTDPVKAARRALHSAQTLLGWISTSDQFPGPMRMMMEAQLNALIDSCFPGVVAQSPLEDIHSDISKRGEESLKNIQEHIKLFIEEAIVQRQDNIKTEYYQLQLREQIVRIKESDLTKRISVLELNETAVQERELNADQKLAQAQKLLKVEIDIMRGRGALIERLCIISEMVASESLSGAKVAEQLQAILNIAQLIESQELNGTQAQVRLIADIKELFPDLEPIKSANQANVSISDKKDPAIEMQQQNISQENPSAEFIEGTVNDSATQVKPELVTPVVVRPDLLRKYQPVTLSKLFGS